MEDKKTYLPAKFLHDEFGNNVVHGPENSGVRIIKSVPTIQNMQNAFLMINNNEELLQEDI